MINLRALRESRGFTQAQMADLLSISRPTYLRIESGRTEMSISQAQKLSQSFQIPIEKIIIDIGAELTPKVNKQKYIQILTACIAFGGDKTDGKITKTKLAKLAYLIDFAWYYNHLDSLTGLEYRRIAQGPVPDLFFSIIDSLQGEGVINLEVKGSAQMIQNNESPSTNLLSKEELTFIKEVCKKWQDRNTKEIVQFTHNQLPWMICNEDDIIPYSLITQEEPSNVY